jgi:phosphoglycolate phosphatase
LYPGVVEGLQALSKLYPLFLVSNCQTEYLDRFRSLTGLGELFQDAECFGATGKPKCDNISNVMRRNGLTNGAYIGDTAGDQIAARRAGLDYYHVTYGFGSPAQECMSFRTFGQVQEFFTALKST